MSGIPSFLALYINCGQSSQSSPFASILQAEGTHPKPHAGAQSRGGQSIDGSHVRDGGLRGEHGAGVSGLCLSGVSCEWGTGSARRAGWEIASAGSCVN